jgi:hypothetical protein
MTEGGIPDEVRRFVRAHIQSVEELEVLLLLFRTAPREWTPVGVSRELRIDPVSAARRLTEFHAHALVEIRAADETLWYRYERASADADGTMCALERTYVERRTRLIELIFAAPIRDVRVFADAFRIRKKESDA